MDISRKIFVSHEIINAIPPRELRTVATGHGPLLAGVDLKEREIRLVLNFAGKSHEHACELASAVAALFCTDEPGEYEPGKMPGRAFSAILREAGDMEWHWGFGTVEYTFIAPRPFSHSIAETVVKTTGENVRIEPRGDVPIRPVIRHKLSRVVAAFVLSIGNDVFFRLRDPSGGTLAANSIFEIDFANRKVTLNGSNAMAYVDYTYSDWHPPILGGTTIRCYDAGETEVRWRDEWM